MKRITSLITALVLLLSILSAAHAEEDEVLSYDFQLRFHLRAEEYPAHDRSRAQGYADLLDLLEFRGNLAWCPSTQSMDLHAELVPVSNPSAAISFRLYGVPDYMCLTTPLLKSETIFLHNYALMEFAAKAWQTFRLPLPYLVLLDPYVTIGAFRPLVKRWNAQFGPLTAGKNLSTKKLSKVEEAWRKDLENEYRLTSWISAFTSPLPNGSIVEREILALPDILHTVSSGKRLTVSESEGVLTVSNRKHQVLFSQKETESSYSCSLTLPETGTDYIPSFEYSAETGGTGRSVTLRAAWDLADDVDPDLESLPDSLLRLFLRLEGIPSAFPADAAVHAAIRIEGYALPNCEYTLDLSTSSDGSIVLSLSRPMGDLPSVPVFSCTGSVVPSAYDGILSFDTSELSGNFNIFSVNDQSLYDFVHRNGWTLFDGLLNFLYELPASSCQSIMDELENHGILELILK